MSGRLATCLFCLLFLISCSIKQGETSTIPDVDVVYVSTVEAAPKLYENDLNSFGTITYRLKNDVTSLVNGTIYFFPVKEGSFVNKGQVIAKLKNVQLEIQKEQYMSGVSSAEAAYEIAKAEYEQALLNVESRLLSIEKSELNIKQRELELELLKKTVYAQEELHKIGGVTDNSIEQQRLQIKSSETNIDILKKELEISLLGLRTEDLVNNGIIPASDPYELKKQIIELNTRTSYAKLASAKASLKGAEQQLNAVNKLIDELTIKAPVSGIVGTRYYELGEYIKENEKVATIIDISSVYAVVNIQENDIVDFSVGTPVAIDIPSIKSKVSSVISEVSPIADSQSGNFSIKIILKNNKDLIRPGMFVKCKIQRSLPENYICIPDTTLLSEEKDVAKVFCVINGFSVQKSVKIFSKKDGNVWLKEGLNKGDMVIDNPSSLLKTGQKVKIIDGNKK